MGICELIFLSIVDLIFLHFILMFSIIRVPLVVRRNLSYIQLVIFWLAVVGSAIGFLITTFIIKSEQVGFVENPNTFHILGAVSAMCAGFVTQRSIDDFKNRNSYIKLHLISGEYTIGMASDLNEVMPEIPESSKYVRVGATVIILSEDLPEKCHGVICTCNKLQNNVYNCVYFIKDGRSKRALSMEVARYVMIGGLLCLPAVILHRM